MQNYTYLAQNYTFVILAIILMVGIVTMPSYAATLTKQDLTKNLKVPTFNPYNHDHNTNVHFSNSLLKGNTINQQNLYKAQGNYVAGQPWGSSSVVAQQATQAHQTQNSQQASNAHQATQATQAHENQPSHQSNVLSPFQTSTNNKILKLP